VIISGIVMAGRPEDGDAIRASVAALPWAQVHYGDSTGRLVVTMEASDIEESMSRLGELKALPQVLMAELAQYSIEGEKS
jgi:nitrate reductase NapAB chaperone NapD